MPEPEQADKAAIRASARRGLRVTAATIAVASSTLAFAQSPPQTKLGIEGAADEFRDRMIYEAIAWRAMFEQVKGMTATEAVELRNKGRDRGLYAFWEWKTPDVLPGSQRDSLMSCRVAAHSARYVINDYTELLLKRYFNEPGREWENKYRLSLSTYGREWKKCERAFPSAVKSMTEAYEASTRR